MCYQFFSVECYLNQYLLFSPQVGISRVILISSSRAVLQVILNLSIFFYDMDGFGILIFNCGILGVSFSGVNIIENNRIRYRYVLMRVINFSKNSRRFAV